jgi:RNA polymerase sigma-70 factor (ECF subfamily)
LVQQKIYTEDQLVQLIRQGDQQAFSYLYDKYAKALLGIIVVYTDSQEEAEDILQTCFVKIWNNFLHYEESKGRLYTWMLNVARNSAIDHTRSKRHKNNLKNQSIDNNATELNKKYQYSDNFDHIGLSTVMSKLKEDHQLILKMAYFEGYTHEELSKELCMPLGTVKTKIRQAIISLRELIK